MKKNVKNYLRRFKEYLSPVFLVSLFLALVLWYLTKLSYTYTAEVPVEVQVAGNEFQVMCVAEGKGYQIVAHRWFRKGAVTLGLHEVQTTPSAVNQGYYVISPFSLQNAISVRNSDLRIISVGELPEIKIDDVQ